MKGANYPQLPRRYDLLPIWETHTPYFEKIIEFYNGHHPGLHGGLPDNVPGGEEMFRFEKIVD